jgi:hypothetical protein
MVRPDRTDAKRKDLRVKSQVRKLDSTLELGTHETFQRGFVFDQKCGAFKDGDLLFTKVGEGAGDRFARGTDDLCDFFVSEGDFDTHARWIGSIAMRPLQEEAGQAFRRGMRESKGANLLVCGLAVAAQMLGSLEAGISMNLQKTEKIVALDEIQLAWLSGFRRDFVRSSGDGSVQTENFARLCDFENQGLAVGGGGGELDAAFAEHIDAARGLALDKQNRACGISGRKFYFFESFEGRFGKSAEKTIVSQLANEAIFNEF